MSRYLDGRPDRSPDLSVRDLRAGDRYMICSDGLSPVVDVAAIRDAMASAVSPAEAVRQLAALADDAGAPDNVTIIVIDVRESGAEEVAAEPLLLGAAAAEAVAR